MEAITAEQELERAKDIVAAVELPPEIVRVEYRTGHDSTGDPAMWVVLWVREQLEFDALKANLLNKAAEEVQLKLLDGDFSRFPYVTLDQAA